MVEKIYKLKNEILQQAEKELDERGPERMDVTRMGEMADIIKDLAEAEKSCWEAQYYRDVVTSSMEKKYGYNSGSQMSGGQSAGAQGGSGRSGYDMPMQSERSGYGMGSMGHDDIIEKLSEEYRQLSPNERMNMKSKILTKLGSM